MKIGGKQWQTTPNKLAQDAAYQDHAGCLTGLWFLPKLAQGMNTTATTNIYIYIINNLTPKYINSKIKVTNKVLLL
jgi:hypothetical protein